MSRTAVLIYGVVCYVFFFLTFLYAMGFMLGWNLLPKEINTGTVGPAGTAMLVNVLLLGLFAIQHEVMARPAFKEKWTKIIPEPVERSTFVLAASACLCLLYWLWQPMPEYIWHVENTALRSTIYAIAILGWLTVLYATFLIDHFDLFGLRQVYLYWKNVPYTRKPFMERSLYKLVRHPLMLGFIIAFWATPDMTRGHLLFAVVTTVYILVALQLEERDLIAAHGDDYVNYKKRTSMLIPMPRSRPPA